MNLIEMIIKIILVLMILFDWISHIVYAFFPHSFIYNQFRILVLSVGYSNFWIIYWGIALILSVIIFFEKK